jgi:hypothetical protein
MSLLAAFSLFMAAGLVLVVVTFSRRMDRQMEDAITSEVPWSYGRIPMTDEEIEQLERDLAARGLFPHYRKQREA